MEGWVRVSLGEVGCSWVKWVKVYHTSSGKVVHKDGYVWLAIPVPTV